MVPLETLLLTGKISSNNDINNHNNKINNDNKNNDSKNVNSNTSNNDNSKRVGNDNSGKSWDWNWFILTQINLKLALFNFD